MWESWGVGKQGGEGIQGWGTAEWWQTSPNWHLTFFLPLAVEWASFQALSGSLLEKCLMQIWRMGSIVKPLILTAHTTMKLCAYSGLVGVWARQWQREQLQSEQTLHRMLCQVILTRMGFFSWGPRLSVKSFINDWNKQMRALFCSGSESGCLYCCWMARLIVVGNTEGMGRKGFTHSLWKTFPLLKHHCLSSMCENVFMLQCCAALPLIFLSSSVCPHCLPLTRSLGWAQLQI